ncbi:MAG: winged helix-turn-helix domain-containing protein [Thermomonas sp.]
MGNEAPGDTLVGSTVRTSVAPFHVGKWLVEPELDRIHGPSGEVALEPKAMAVLMRLALDPGKVVSAEELIRDVWLGRPMGDNPVYRCIAQLRRAFGDDTKAPRHIATVPTKGYRLIAPVAPTRALTAPATMQSGDEMRAYAPVADVADQGQRSRSITTWLLAMLLAGTAMVAWQLVSRPAAGVTASSRPKLAVFPLRAASTDGGDILLAQSATDMIRNRLAELDQLDVLASSATAGLAVSPDQRQHAAEKLDAKFLLVGNVQLEGGRVQGGVQLLDVASDTHLWEFVFDRPRAEFAAIQDDILRGVTRALKVPVENVVLSGHAGTNLDAYQLYIRGKQLLGNKSGPETARAVELFRRATILDPEFARSYVGIGQALVLQMGSGNDGDAALRAMATKAFDQALRLNPALGEALIEKARVTDDPVQAEDLFRKGLELAPNEGAGYAHYAKFLFRNSRLGEAMDTISRAIQIDARSPELYLTQASFVMIARSDVAEHDRLVRTALAINPALPDALYQLAYSNWEFSGEFADGARLIEQAILGDPTSIPARLLARDIYLDLGDPEAADAVLGQVAGSSSRVPLAQYRGDVAGAAALLVDTAPRAWPDAGPQAAAAQAVRDAAIQAGDLKPAVLQLGRVHAIALQGIPMWRRGFTLVYAHTLVLAGEPERGRALVQSTLDVLDIHSVGRPATWLNRERATGHMVLGEHVKALDALQGSVGNGQVYRWWYLAEHDPLYAPIRHDPRFQAMGQQVRAHRNQQRATLEQMRRTGVVPVRKHASAAAGVASTAR